MGISLYTFTICPIHILYIARLFKIYCGFGWFNDLWAKHTKSREWFKEITTTTTTSTRTGEINSIIEQTKSKMTQIVGFLLLFFIICTKLALAEIFANQISRWHWHWRLRYFIRNNIVALPPLCFHCIDGDHFIFEIGDISYRRTYFQNYYYICSNGQRLNCYVRKWFQWQIAHK